MPIDRGLNSECSQQVVDITHLPSESLAVIATLLEYFKNNRAISSPAYCTSGLVEFTYAFEVTSSGEEWWESRGQLVSSADPLNVVCQ